MAWGDLAAIVGAVAFYVGSSDGTRPDWIVVGQESRPRARTCNHDPVRSVLRQCREARIPVHIKQIHLGAPGSSCKLDCCKPRVSSDMREWPSDLRVRQWPEVAA